MNKILIPTFLIDGNSPTQKILGFSYKFFENDEKTGEIIPSNDNSGSFYVLNTPTDYCSASSGLTEDFLRSHTHKTQKECSELIFNLFTKCVNEGIYICCWGMTGAISDLLSNGLDKEYDVSFIKNTKLIVDTSSLLEDVKQLEKLGRKTLNSVTYLTYSGDIDSFKTDVADKLWGETFLDTLAFEQLRVLKYLMCDYLNFKSIRELVCYIYEPRLITTLTFGKYCGSNITTVINSDIQYITWLYHNAKIMSANPNLKFTLDNFFQVPE